MLLLTLPTKWLLRECPGLGFGLNALLAAAFGFVVSLLVDLGRRAALLSARECLRFDVNR